MLCWLGHWQIRNRMARNEVENFEMDELHSVKKIGQKMSHLEKLQMSPPGEKIRELIKEV